ncbi:hypothetical protein SEA_GODONK_176 [Gordonia phage GodonK]|nr:hypothetical protein HOV33_gp192 [Gordonia phage GodonK]QBZ72764.1 hypothetical protein SEA_GODONK_176 [Gordonia phage GodonK]
MIICMSSKSTRRRKRFLCADCGVDTGKMHEFYFVKTELWLYAMHSTDGMLCIEHLEKRLGRQLRAEDFTDASINDPRKNTMSTRLLERLRR